MYVIIVMIVSVIQTINITNIKKGVYHEGKGEQRHS